jgi:hypothetical protein
MPGLDTWLAELAHGEAVVVVLAIAMLLGLRHASDPDHLAAVSTLIATEPRDGVRRAGRLGLAWGLGHAATLALFGVPIVLFHAYMPGGAQHAAEALVGVIIMLLAARLLVLGREARLGRSPWEAFGIGLVHGMAGSAGVGVLLLAAVPGEAEALAALLVLAAGTAISMALLSSAFGYAITRGPVLTRMVAFGPAMGMAALAFGAWYTLAAVGALPAAVG